MKKQSVLKSNKGFTLVEVIVACTILALVAVPLLHPFVTAARTNAKAKKIQQSTDFATSIMEKLKSENLENVSRNFNGCANDKDGIPISTNVASGSVSVGGNPFGYGELVKTADGYAYAADAEQSVYTVTNENAPDKTFFRPRADGSYYFIMPNVSAYGLDTDVLVRYSAQKTYALTNILSMNRSDCAYFAEDSQLKGTSANNFAEKSKSTGTPLTSDQFLSLMTKTVTVNIEQDNRQNITVTVKYEFDAGEGNVEDVDRYITTETLVFDNYSTQSNLTAVYIYYYPLYGVSTSGRDSFVINNMSNLGVDVYFIAMNNFETNELNKANYKARLSVNEKAIIGENRLCVKVHSNVSNTKWTKSSSVPAADIRGWSVSDLGNATNQQLTYEVTVYVYKHEKDAFKVVNERYCFNPSDDDLLCCMQGTSLDSSNAG